MTNIDRLRQLATIIFTRMEEDYDVGEDFEPDMAEQLREEAKWNEWAWFCAKVTASYAGIRAHAYLGGCSYNSEEEFKSDEYYAQLVTDALSELASEIDATRDLIKELDTP